jgi:transcriptional regulator GlxA family with amidase domain
VGIPPHDYYLALRLNAGRRLVLESRKSMAEVAAQTGFGSASAFARAFRSRFGESPPCRPRPAVDNLNGRFHFAANRIKLVTTSNCGG